MSKLAQRLLIFFIGIPAVIGLVLIKFCYHLPLNLAIIGGSIIASFEMYKMFSIKTPLLPKALLVILTVVMTIGAYLFSVFNINQDYITWLFIFCLMILMAAECFGHKTYEDSIVRLSASSYIICYCGYFFTFIQRIGTFENSTFFLSLFFFTVFINDSLAWLFGILLGKNNRGIFAASPNKSVMGCIGGLIGAVASCVLAKVIWPDFLPGNFVKPVLLGLFCSIGAVIGDLIESVYKRSSDVKDSGSIVPGRGGALDSIDSLLFTAPIFYILVFFMYNPVTAG